MKAIYCFAGPNGSGKSSIFKNVVESNQINCEYVNPDVIATMEPFSSIDDYTERNKLAGEYARELRAKYVTEGKSFAFETVLSHPSHLDFLKNAKEQGYEIVLVYVTTQDPSINIERVGTRVSQGGHDVDKNKIVERYKRSSQLLPSAIEIADKAFVFDNTIKHTLSIVKVNGKTYSLSTKKGVPNHLVKKDFLPKSTFPRTSY
jgi:predicted ABC-type ATPase